MPIAVLVNGFCAPKSAGLAGIVVPPTAGAAAMGAGAPTPVGASPKAPYCVDVGAKESAGGATDPGAGAAGAVCAAAASRAVVVVTSAMGGVVPVIALLNLST